MHHEIDRLTAENKTLRDALLNILELNHPKFPPTQSWAKHVLKEATAIATEALMATGDERENKGMGDKTDG